MVLLLLRIGAQRLGRLRNESGWPGSSSLFYKIHLKTVWVMIHDGQLWRRGSKEVIKEKKTTGCHRVEDFQHFTQ